MTPLAHDDTRCPDWCLPDTTDPAAGILHASDWDGVSHADGTSALTRTEITPDGPRVALALCDGTTETVVRLHPAHADQIADAITGAATDAAFRSERHTPAPPLVDEGQADDDQADDNQADEEDDADVPAPVRLDVAHRQAAAAPNWPPTHDHAGSNSARQSIGKPGHCEHCATVGHIAAHPDRGCSDVGCNHPHDQPTTTGDRSRPAPRAREAGQLAELQAELDHLAATDPDVAAAGARYDAMVADLARRAERRAEDA